MRTLIREHLYSLGHSLLVLRGKTYYLTYIYAHSYGAVWTGDNGSDYKDMKISIHMLLSMSVAGLGFVGADIGGFANSTSARVLT